MSSTFRLKLLTPERTLSEEDVLSVSLPTLTGEITILSGHVALASLLVAGVVRIKRSAGEEELAVSGGFIQVSDKGQNVTVLADTAERGHELDLIALEAAKERARQVMREAIKQDDVSFAAAAAALERELARHRVASRHQAHKQHPLADRARIKHKDNNG